MVAIRHWNFNWNPISSRIVLKRAKKRKSETQSCIFLQSNTHTTFKQNCAPFVYYIVNECSPVNKMVTPAVVRFVSLVAFDFWVELFNFDLIDFHIYMQAVQCYAKLRCAHIFQLKHVASFTKYDNNHATSFVDWNQYTLDETKCT